MGLVGGLELELDLGLGLGMGWDWLQDTNLRRDLSGDYSYNKIWVWDW